jgi:hypothetical protein
MENIVPFPQRSVPYAKVLDWDTLKVVTGKFRSLHPDLLPIVVYRILQDVWVGELTADQVKQALRDCYDMCVRASASERGLYAPVGFVQKRLLLCLENQALGLDPESLAMSPDGPSSAANAGVSPVALLVPGDRH